MSIEKLHGAANSTIAKIILGLITISFLVGGMSGYLFSSSDSYAAKVNGESISQQEFLNRYNGEIERLVQTGGNDFLTQLDSVEFTNSIRQSLINLLINQELLRQYAKELKLTVTDEMIKTAIVKDSNFQTDGKFNNQLYLQILQANNLTSDQYAAILRNALTLDQMQNGLTNSDFVVPAQVTETEKLFFQTRNARLATFSLSEETAKQSVSEQEIQSYYAKNTKLFTQPESVKVQYIEVSRQDVENNIQVKDVEIAQYYQDNQAQFSSQQVAHIQLATEQEAEAIYQELQQGADFAMLAKTRSQDPVSRVNGGDLGWINAGEFPVEFEQALATLKVGQYSQPINIDGSFHIILLKQRKTQSLAETKDSIAQLIRQNLADERYYAIENQVKEKAFEDSQSLQSAANVAKVNIRETDYFSAQNAPEPLNSANVIAMLFDSEISAGGINSEPINLSDQKFVVLRVLDHKAEGVKSYEEVKEQIKQMLLREKAEKVLLEQAQQQLTQLNEGKLSELEFSASQPFSLIESADPILMDSLFAMAKPEQGKTAYQIGRNQQGDVVIIALDSIQEGKLEPQQSLGFANHLAQESQLALQQQLIQGLREKAQIEINDAFINQDDSELNY